MHLRQAGIVDIKQLGGVAMKMLKRLACATSQWTT